MADNSSARVKLVLDLFQIGALKFGNFTLKSGIESPVYFDLRIIVSYPAIMQQVADEMWKSSDGLKFDQLCGVPYTALPISTCMSTKYGVPMMIKRKEAKSYGTKKLIEGKFEKGVICLVIEDVVTTGSSVMETARDLASVDVVVHDAIVLLDRCQGGRESLAAKGIKLHSVFTMKEVLSVLEKFGKLEQDVVRKVNVFIEQNSKVVPVSSAVTPNSLTYEKRATTVTNSIAKKLFSIMVKKESNLCLSADLTSSQAILDLIRKIGDHICMVKLHVDIIEDFSMEFIVDLQRLSLEQDFVIFEDRKFADIGNTVKYQYGSGLYRIADWADIVNAHGIPGEGVVKGLKEVGSQKGRACLLIAQMSSDGNLATGSYTDEIVKMAEQYKDFVIGFICTSRVSNNPTFIHMTPGVKLECGTDRLGQQYLTPHEVITKRGCDLIIVGRGIYAAHDPNEAAIAYKNAGFNAYKARI
ncbi:uridine 5'-monophosphate synthase-like [Xenia sp. Carnegie-2017]|uniref:uridine 5'-monophosphate synthase-like n=1 Tax=Xenia sp. Carnegie-2017 TaxID=2897299 RepID=UPI001F03AAE5|nr:uridine 5'-monophosphate synthase-like [Xenia sp. Carnegie-2017]